MWVLSLDTTTQQGSVALLRDDTVIVERAGADAGNHAERLPGAIAEVVAEAGLTAAALDLFAVASGPGGFTGLRIGLATIQGLALALDRPAVGVSSLAATAWRHLEAHTGAAAVGAWLEASRGEVFSAAYAAPGGDASWPLVELGPPTSATPAATIALWQGVVPEGMAVLGGDRHSALLQDAGLRGTTSGPLLATAVGRIGWRLHQQGQSGPPHALAPLYVRRPDVERERERRDAVAAQRR